MRFSPTPSCSRPFSLNVCMTIAVDDMARARPMARAACQLNPTRMNSARKSRAVIPTCTAPDPRMRWRIRQKWAGSSSSPMRKSIITTPNSAKCIMFFPSPPTKPRKKGPIVMPARRYPRTDPMPSRLAMGTKRIAAPR